MEQEQKFFLDKNADKILTKISVEEVIKSKNLINDFANEIASSRLEEERFKIINTRFGIGQNSILHLAAKFADELTVKKILKEAQNEQYVNVKNDDGFTPLHFSAINGNIAATQALISAGADLNAQASEKKRRWTPIHYAAKFGHVEIVEALINGGLNKEIRTGFGLSPLVVAAEFGQLKVVEFMLEIGADKNVQTIEDNHKMTALHYAVIGDFTDVVIALLNAKADKEKETTFGLTALEFAAKNNFSEIVVLLMSYGAKKWDEALKIAQKNKCEEVINQIKKYQKAKANLFSTSGLNKIYPNLAAVLKQFNSSNLSEMKITLEDGVTFNAYGILSLSHYLGLFKKVEKTLINFVEESGFADLSKNLKALLMII